MLYANVVLQSASEAIKEGVSTKIQELKRLAPPLKQRLAKHVSRIAADKVSAKVVVDRLAPKLVADIPVKMKKKGLTVHVEEVFRDGPYFVLMLQVQHVDAAVMVEAKELAKKKGEVQVEDEASSCSLRAVKWLLQLMGVTLADTVQTEYLPDLIQSKIQPHLAEQMVAEMADKKMHASVEVVPEAKQSRFFYALLHQVRTEVAAKRKTPAVILNSLKAKRENGNSSVSGLKSRRGKKKQDADAVSM